MSRYPLRLRTRSEVARGNVYRAQVFQQLIQISLPLSFRIIGVKTAMGNMRLRRPYTALQQETEDACNSFDRCILYFVNCLADPNYIVHGGEVSQATRDLNLFANRAELLLHILQNTSRVRRELTYV